MSALSFFLQILQEFLVDNIGFQQSRNGRDFLEAIIMCTGKIPGLDCWQYPVQLLIDQDPPRNSTQSFQYSHDCRGTAVGNEALPAGDHILRFGGRRGRLSRACIPHNEKLQRRGLVQSSLYSHHPQKKKAARAESSLPCQISQASWAFSCKQIQRGIHMSS